ncbi:MAG: glycosyltransferase family 2 protein [Acidimicrobiales bacterium]|nr:glycosyltransferase family 2 protein [Acidimicrobiales bacterium]
MADAPFTAIVVNYRSGDRLRTCIDSLLSAGGPLSRIIVVDNSPGDPSIGPAVDAQVAGKAVTVLEAPQNLGLAGAVNLAMAHVDTPFVVSLNPDVTVTNGWLEPLGEALESGAGVACPLIRIQGTDRINSLGQIIHVSGFGFNRLLERPLSGAPTEPHRVGGLHGAAFAIRADVLRGLGGWDDTGFLYQEDAALSWDVLLAGQTILAVPASVVDHDYHLTMYPEKFHLLERNRLALLLSHLKWSRLFLLFPILLAVELAVWVFASVRGSGFVRAKARSYAWVLANRRRISGWRRRVMSRPVYDGRSLRRHTTWGVPWDQVLKVGRERGPSTRIPEGGLPSGPDQT